jgi:uncharacterized protein (DUF169 family)
MNMTSDDWDLQGWIEVFKKLKLEVPPVGVRFSINPLDGVKRLSDHLRLCEMLKRAQQGEAFSAAPENHACTGGLYIMGKSLPYVYTTGEYVAGLQIFNSARAGRRLYDYIPRLDAERNISYVAFSPLDKIAFVPDLILVLAQVDQTEILLRALSYSSGKVWMSKSSSVIGCSWTYMYPYITGELNYVVTGLSMGMKAMKLFPPGWQLISIPNDLFPMMLDNLKKMPLILPLLQPGGDEFRKNLLIKLGLDPSH